MKKRYGEYPYGDGETGGREKKKKRRGKKILKIFKEGSFLMIPI